MEPRRAVPREPGPFRRAGHPGSGPGCRAAGDAPPGTVPEGRAPGIEHSSSWIREARRSPGMRSELQRRAAVTRRMGRLLLTMKRRQLYRSLGFVRMGDYVAERLGLSHRTAQELVRTEEALQRLPLSAAAFEAGEISPSHLRLLSREADPITEEFWVTFARRATVRELDQAMQAALRAGGQAAGMDGSPAEAGRPGGSEGTRPAGPHNGTTAPDLASPSDTTGLSSSRPGRDVEEAELRLLEISAPAWMISMWRESLAMIRQAGGGFLTPGSALECALAEFQVGVLDAESGGEGPSVGSHGPGVLDRSARPGASGGEAVHRGQSGKTGSLPSSHLGIHAEDPLGESAGHRGANGDDPGSVREAAATRAGTESGVHPPGTRLPDPLVAATAGSASAIAPSGMESAPRTGSPALSGCLKPGHRCDDREAPAPAPMAEDRLPAREVDSRLRALVSERQLQQSRLAAHLFLMRETRGYLREGHMTLAAYARELWDLSPRMLRYLLALHRQLERLGALRHAFETGRLTLRQALLIASVAEGATLQAWLERAGRVTLRRLGDEVELWRHLKETRPEIWARLEGNPLPDGILLVPGRPPELAVHGGSSPSDRQPDGEIAPRDMNRDRDWGRGRHMSAPEFLQALRSDEMEVPLPDRMGHIRIRVEPEVAAMWRETLAGCRRIERNDLEEWEVLALVLHHLWSEWDNEVTRRQRRDHPALERDGWRCTAPGCGSMGTGHLHTHHIVFRSAGGELRSLSNLTTLCTGHHQGLLHEGRMHCQGVAPGALVWDLGIEPGQGAFLRYDGESRTGGQAM